MLVGREKKVDSSLLKAFRFIMSTGGPANLLPNCCNVGVGWSLVKGGRSHLICYLISSPSSSHWQTGDILYKALYFFQGLSLLYQNYIGLSISPLKWYKDSNISIYRGGSHHNVPTLPSSFHLTPFLLTVPPLITLLSMRQKEVVAKQTLVKCPPTKPH